MSVLHRLVISPAAIGVALASFLLLLVGSQAGLGGALKAALLLLILCYWPAALWFHGAGTAPSLAESIIYLLVGWAGLALWSLLVAAGGAEPGWALAPSVVVTVVGLGWRLRARQSAGEARQSDTDPGPSPREVIVGIVLVLIAASIYVAPALYMGAGPFPAVFIGDAGYHLGLTWGLLRDPHFLPESLSYAGGHRFYHYGPHAMAAVLSRFAGLLPHTGLFLIVEPMLLAGIAAAVWRFARERHGAMPFLGALGLLLVGVGHSHSQWPPYVDFVKAFAAIAHGGPQMSVDIGAALSVHMLNPTLFFGTFAIALVMLCAVNPQRIGWQAMMAFVIGILIAFKAPYFIALGLGLGMWSLWRAARERSIRPLLIPAAALILALVIYAFVGLGGSGAKLAFEPFAGQNISQVGKYLLRSVAVLLPGLLVLILSRGRALSGAAGLWLVYAAAPIIIMLLTNLYLTEGVPEEANFDEMLNLLPPVLAGFSVSLMATWWPRFGATTRRIAVGALGLIIVPHLIRWAWLAVLVAIHPEAGYEYVDNRPLAAALATVPTDTGLIVTNDLRYPAEGWRRDNQAVQFPALFGHRNFFVNPTFERFYPDLEERRDAVRRLQQPQWDPAILELARRYGWTHFVVHLDYPHPADIPLPVAYDGGSYRVYRFGP